MKGARNTGFVVSLALLASLVGHFAVQRHFERQARSRDYANSGTTSPKSPPKFNLQGDKPAVDALNMPRLLGSNRRVVLALDVQEGNGNLSTRQTANPPAEVPSPTDSSSSEDSSTDPKETHEEDTSAVRDVIEYELSHATREEREIWFDELKSLPAGVVRDLLQVRKQLRALPRIHGGVPEKLASADPAMLDRTHEVPAEHASQRIRFNSPDHLASAMALESAISQLRHNLANASTPGFKRLRISLVDAYSVGARDLAHNDEPRPEQLSGVYVQGDGCRIATPLLDLKQGSLKKTARQFDLAIDGEGFFVVRRGEKEFLTRSGAFTLDRDRRLCLAIVNEIAVLQPPITIPPEAREVQVSADGAVTVAVTNETSLTVIGNVTLARVASPSRLQPMGNTLFAINENSGPLFLGSPMTNGFGEIQQGFLERSNVEFEKELEEIDELSLILKSLPPHNPRPATASTHRESEKN